MKNLSLLLALTILLTSNTSYTEMITIVSFNIRREGKEKLPAQYWCNRKEKVIDFLNTVDADIMGLQEAGIGQITDIMRGLNNTYAWYGTGRKQKGIAGLFCSVDEHNPIIYRTDRLQLIDAGTFWLNPCKKKGKPGWGAWLNRICTWARMRHIKTDTYFWVFNTHLDNQQRAARVGGLRLILNDIAARTNNEPVILMGDFNAPITDGALARVIAHASFRLINGATHAQKSHPFPGTALTKKWGGGYKTIDHILFSASPAWSIFDYQVHFNLGGTLSDHAPIVARALVPDNVLIL